MATILFKNANTRKLTSKFRGVCWNKASKAWLAKIKVHGTQKIIGFFTDEIEAARAYNREAIKVHGEQFATLNIF